MTSFFLSLSLLTNVMGTLHPSFFQQSPAAKGLQSTAAPQTHQEHGCLVTIVIVTHAPSPFRGCVVRCALVESLIRSTCTCTAVSRSSPEKKSLTSVASVNSQSLTYQSYLRFLFLFLFLFFFSPPWRCYSSFRCGWSRSPSVLFVSTFLCVFYFR